MNIQDIANGLSSMDDMLNPAKQTLNHDDVRNAQQNAAILETADSTSRTAKATELLQKKVSGLTDGLDKERQERAVEDNRIFKHTVKYARLNFVIALIGTITGVTALIVSIFK